MLFALGVIILTMTPTMLGEALAPVAHTRRGLARALERPDPPQLLPLLQATAIMLVSAAVLLLLAAMTSVVFF
jgi:hypothetical protein